MCRSFGVSRESRIVEMIFVRRCLSVRVCVMRAAGSSYTLLFLNFPLVM